MASHIHKSTTKGKRIWNLLLGKYIYLSTFFSETNCGYCSICKKCKIVNNEVPLMMVQSMCV